MKSKVFRKVTALSLTCAMVLGVAACGGQEPESQTSADSRTEESKSAESSAGGQEESGPGAGDGAYVPGTLPLTTEPATITIGLAKHVNTEDYETNEYTLWLEEQTGIDLEFVLFSNDATEYKNQLTLMMTGGEKLPDILLSVPFGADGVKSYGMDGYFVDMSSWLEQEGTWYDRKKDALPEDVTRKIEILGKAEDGGIYGYPYYSHAVLDATLAPCYINKAWLDKVEADMPTTPDELYEVLVKFRDGDPNGNGIADELPITGTRAYRSATDQWLINAFVYCVDNYLWNVTDGELWSPYSTDEYREAMKYLKKLVDEKLLQTMVFTADTASSTIKPLVTPPDGVGIVGVITCTGSLHMDQDSPLLTEYTALAPLKAPEGNTLGGYAAWYDDTYKYINVITEDCENPELAFHLLDFMSSTDSVLRQRYGVYGKDWTDAEEGALTASGTPAMVKVLDSSAYSGQNNRCWHIIHCCVTENIGQSYVADGSGLSVRNSLERDARQVCLSCPTPEETFTVVAYTPAEQEVVTGLQKPFADYVKEARGLFATGVLDPNSDTDWNNYLAELEARGQSQLLECAQAAYDRMKQ